MKSIIKKKGFTIVEMLIYMGLLSVLLVSMTALFSSIIDSRLEAESKSAIEQDGDFLLARMFYDISRADTITTPATSGSSSPTLLLVIGGVTYTYQTANNKLQLTNNLGSNILNSESSNISNLSFARNGLVGSSSTITMSFTLTSTTRANKGYEVKDFSTTVGLRK